LFQAYLATLAKDRASFTRLTCHSFPVFFLLLAIINQLVSVLAILPDAPIDILKKSFRKMKWTPVRKIQ